MKKKTAIALITAAVLILLGAIIAGLGMSAQQFDIHNLNSSRQTESVHPVAGPVQSIRINTQESDILFVLTDDQSQVTCRETDKVYHTVTVEDSVLKINVVDERSWYDRIGIFWEAQQITVALSQAEYESLWVHTDTGDIHIPDAFSFTEASLNSDTGNVSYSAAVSEDLSIVTATGNQTIQGCSPTSMKLLSSTGNIQLEAAAGEGEYSIGTSTGSIQVSDVTCKVFSCNSATGDTVLTQVIANDYLQAFNDTGDITITDCDTGKANLKTDTGDISGNFLTPKIFSAISDTGNIHVPRSATGGPCDIETETGDIFFQ